MLLHVHTFDIAEQGMDLEDVNSLKKLLKKEIIGLGLFQFVTLHYLANISHSRLIGGAVAQSVKRATPGEEVPGSIPAVASRSLLVGSMSV